MSKNYISHSQCSVHDPKIRLKGYNRCTTKQKLHQSLLKSIVFCVATLEPTICLNSSILPSYDGIAQPNVLLYLYLCQYVTMGGIG